MMGNITYPITKLEPNLDNIAHTLSALESEEMPWHERSLALGMASLEDVLARWSMAIDLSLRCDHPHIRELTKTLVLEFRSTGKATFGYRVDVLTALGMLIANIIKVEMWQQGAFVSYSRKPKTYTYGRYNKTEISFRAISAALDVLRGLELVEDYRGRQIGGRGYKALLARLRGLPDLFLRLAIHDHPDILQTLYQIPNVCDPIRLKNTSGKLIDYPETLTTTQMREVVSRYNDFIRDCSISLDADPVDEQGNPLNIDFNRNQLYRVFNNGSFDEGGRFYGGWWQEIPKHCRPYITINGNQTVELDYGSLVVHQAYASIGQDYWEVHGNLDPYEVIEIDLPRSIKKLAFLAALNSQTRYGAALAIVKAINESAELKDYREIPPEEFYPLFDAIILKNMVIAPLFFTNPSRRFQFMDAQICESVVSQCLASNLTALPIHDSFITPLKDESTVRKIMRRAYLSVARLSLPSISCVTR